MNLTNERETVAKNERVRIQFDLTPAMRELLDKLVDESGASTRAEVMRRALSIYSILIDETSSGKRVVLVADDGKSEEIRLVP